MAKHNSLADIFILSELWIDVRANLSIMSDPWIDKANSCIWDKILVSIVK